MHAPGHPDGMTEATEFWDNHYRHHSNIWHSAGQRLSHRRSPAAAAGTGTRPWLRRGRRRMLARRARLARHRGGRLERGAGTGARRGSTARSTRVHCVSAARPGDKLPERTVRSGIGPIPAVAVGIRPPPRLAVRGHRGELGRSPAHHRSCLNAALVVGSRLPVCWTRGRRGIVAAEPTTVDSAASGATRSRGHRTARPDRHRLRRRHRTAARTLDRRSRA
jgi:hypothetical protein